MHPRILHHEIKKRVTYEKGYAHPVPVPELSNELGVPVPELIKAITVLQDLEFVEYNKGHEFIRLTTKGFLAS